MHVVVQRQGIRGNLYLDDWLSRGWSHQDGSTALNAVLDWFRELGLIIDNTKILPNYLLTVDLKEL